MLIDYFLGVDLGQSGDYTAVCVLEKQQPLSVRSQPSGEPQYLCKALKRYPLGTKYPAIVEDVENRLRDAPFMLPTYPNYKPAQPNKTIAIDGSGVGRAVCDMFTENSFLSNQCDLKLVTITAGDSENYADGYHRVAKKLLVSYAVAALQTERLKISTQMSEAVTLVNELKNFKIKFTKHGTDTYEAWRDGQHDDLVLATSLAIWAGENFPSMTADEEMELRRSLFGHWSRRESTMRQF